MAGKKKGKKKWVNMEIVKVKLNPEQAVLTCCEVRGTPLKFGQGCSDHRWCEFNYNTNLGKKCASVWNTGDQLSS